MAVEEHRIRHLEVVATPMEVEVDMEGTEDMVEEAGEAAIHLTAAITAHLSEEVVVAMVVMAAAVEAMAVAEVVDIAVVGDAVEDGDECRWKRRCSLCMRGLL